MIPGRGHVHEVNDENCGLHGDLLSQATKLPVPLVAGGSSRSAVSGRDGPAEALPDLVFGTPRAGSRRTEARGKQSRVSPRPVRRVLDAEPPD